MIRKLLLGFALLYLLGKGVAAAWSYFAFSAMQNDPSLGALASSVSTWKSLLLILSFVSLLPVLLFVSDIRWFRFSAVLSVFTSALVSGYAEYFTTLSAVALSMISLTVSQYLFSGNAIGIKTLLNVLLAPAIAWLYLYKLKPVKVYFEQAPVSHSTSAARIAVCIARVAILALLIIVVALVVGGGSRNAESRQYLGNDIRLFKSTPVWSLAKAVASNNEKKVNKAAKRVNVNHREPRFGRTLLMLSANNGWEFSCKALLANGADPNLQDTYDGDNAVMEAVGWGPGDYCDVTILNMLLNAGADHSLIQSTIRRDGNRTRKTPLMNAAGSCFAKTQVLVEAGADINYVNEYNGCALSSAIHGGKDAARTVEYLIIEKGADITLPKVVTISGDTLRIGDMLRDWLFELDSEDYVRKMRIVEYIEKHGETYWDTPVPKHFFRNHSVEYLSIY